MRQFELRRILVTRDTLIQKIMDSSGRYGLEKRTHNLYSHNFYDGWHREKWYIILNIVNVKITYHFCIDDFMRFIVFCILHGCAGAAQAWSTYAGLFLCSGVAAPPSHGCCAAYPVPRHPRQRRLLWLADSLCRRQKYASKWPRPNTLRARLPGRRGGRV